MDDCVLVVRLYHLPVLAASHKYSEHSIDAFFERAYVWNYCIPRDNGSTGRPGERQRGREFLEYRLGRPSRFTCGANERPDTMKGANLFLHWRLAVIFQ
jgi:hypothetical protein